MESSFQYLLTADYRWYNKKSTICLFYYIQGTPFTFDELPSLMQDHPEVIAEADSHEPIEPEELWRASNYLSLEQMHPCLFELNVDNPELLPDLAQ
jgi:hypothetical protein|tara:strand:- start:643 stop:930 length:288 start_codon:yes stop_codon:yes gene_type:complete